MAKKYCYLFSEGNANMRELLGGKGANLAEMTNIGLPVPQGFTITTEACTQYYEDGGISDEIMAEINEYIVKMEEITGKKFGDKENPLLVSVRSGARASMPGMMDTILNLGLNETVVETIAAKSGLCAYTSGLRVLGYEEMEVINSQLQPDQVIGMLYAISEYVVSEEVTLKDGETIGFTDEQKIPIAVSKGVSVEGETIKIGL